MPAGESCRPRWRRRSPSVGFRDALRRHPKEEAHFFQFKERRARERAIEWLTGRGSSKGLVS
jgi:GrpB-like predicted nucleotidyltransferase (UPF0157 family)